MRRQRKISPFSRHNRTKEIEINLHACSGCGRCVHACRYGVLGHVSVFGLHRHAHVDLPQNCRGCLTCVTTCPTGAIMSTQASKSLESLQRILILRRKRLTHHAFAPKSLGGLQGIPWD